MSSTQAPPPDLVFLCDWLPPDFGAVGQYSLLRAREIAAGGRSVALYGLSSERSSVEEERFGGGALKVVRLKAPIYSRSSLRQRAWWTLRTNAALVLRALSDMRRCREVLFTGSPPFLLHLVAPLNLFLRRRLIYRITDFYPECLIAERGRSPWPLRLFHAVTRFWRRRVDRFEVLGEDQRRRLEQAGVLPQKIEVRRDPSPVVFGEAVAPLAPPAALAGRKILLYSGNFGVAHDYETLVSGYAKHHRAGSGKVGLWINAIGSRADLAERAVTRERLPVCRTLPVPLEKLASLLVAAAAHLITLREPFWGYVLPSKVYACIESRRPILFIGPKSSDVHLLCSRDARVPRYWQVDPGDGEGVYRALEELAAA